MSRPNWVDVLDALYENEQQWRFYREGEHPEGLQDSDHPLAEESGISGSDLDAAVDFLQDKDLVEETSSGWKLTNRGFDTITDWKRRKAQERINSAMVFLTGILGMMATVNASKTLWNLPTKISFPLGVLIGGAVVVLLHALSDSY
ncbi:MAG: hypothetical protein ABEI86_12130 [Halobacteriaceae archaeon]